MWGEICEKSTLLIWGGILLLFCLGVINNLTEAAPWEPMFVFQAFLLVVGIVGIVVGCKERKKEKKQTDQNSLAMQPQQKYSQATRTSVEQPCGQNSLAEHPRQQNSLAQRRPQPQKKENDDETEIDLGFGSCVDGVLGFGWLFRENSSQR